MALHQPDDVVIEHVQLPRKQPRDVYRVAGIDFHSREQAEAAALAVARSAGVSVWVAREGGAHELLASFRNHSPAEPARRTKRQTLEDLLGLVTELAARETLDDECPPAARAVLIETQAALTERLAPKYGDSPIPPDDANRQRLDMTQASVLCTNKTREAFDDILRMYEEYLTADPES